MFGCGQYSGSLQSLLPGGKTGEGSRTNTPHLTQLVANFLHLRMSYLCSTLQFNKGFHPPLLAHG